MKDFINQTTKKLTEMVKAGQHFPMTVYNLAHNKDNEVRVFVNEFALNEDVDVTTKLEIIKNCILGTEWESAQIGYETECTIYAESGIKDGINCLILQTKIGDKEDMEVILFEETGMCVNQKGAVEIDYNEKSYLCDLNQTN